MKVAVRQPNMYDEKAASQEAATINEEPSLTVQDAAEDADINVMVARFGLTGSMPSNPATPMYGDFTEITDYRSAVEAVEQASEKFMALPPQLRAYFQNDPQALMEYEAKEGHAKLIELGLDLTVPPSERKAQPSATEVPPNGAE